MASHQLIKNLSPEEMCQERDRVVMLITKAVESLAEADLILNTIASNGFSFDRNTFSRPSEPSRKLQTINSLITQCDRKFWYHLFNKGQFTDWMSVDRKEKLDEQMENPPKFDLASITTTFREMSLSRNQFLCDLIRSAFLSRSTKLKSNLGHKINKKFIIQSVFGRGYQSNSVGQQRLRDIENAIARVTGLERPHVLNILETEDEYEGFNGAVKFRAYYTAGTVHVMFQDETLLNKLNKILAESMESQLYSE